MEDGVLARRPASPVTSLITGTTGQPELWAMLGWALPLPCCLLGGSEHSDTGQRTDFSATGADTARSEQSWANAQCCGENTGAALLLQCREQGHHSGCQITGGFSPKFLLVLKSVLR